MRVRVCLALVTLLILGTGSLALAENAGESTTFSGSYDWKQGGRDDLSAEFTPDGENRWKVTFRFRWSDKDHTWTGAAEGSLEAGGKLTGTATSGSRNWNWEAGIKDGVMRGSHTEIKGSGNGTRTGTFELKR